MCHNRQYYNHLHSQDFTQYLIARASWVYRMTGSGGDRNQICQNNSNRGAWWRKGNPNKPRAVKQSRKFGMELKGSHAVKLLRMSLCKRILL
jgi:hypothetical protein